MAGSIKLFQFVRKCHQILGIQAWQPNPKQKQHSTNLTKTIFLIFCAQIMFSAVAFLLFEAKSLFDYGLTVYVLITTANAIAVYLIFVWQSENTLEFIENCEEFIRKRSQSTAAYEDSIEKIELFNKILCFGIGSTCALVTIVLAPYSFLRYYIFDMGEDSFYLFFPAWFPFNWKTPFGYLVAWLVQCAGLIPIASIVGQFVNFLIGLCWLFILIAEDITQDVAAFNIATKTTSNENRTELRKRICDTVRIYSDAKQCVTEFNQLFKYSLFAFILWDLLGVSGLLATIQFDLWADGANSFEITLLTLVLNWMILFIFLLCEPGTRMTNQFEEFSDELNRCDWYLLPMELQRCYLIFILDTQNPIKVLSYANITCKRETSKKIIKKAFSYFMTLRNFRP